MGVPMLVRPVILPGEALDLEPFPEGKKIRRNGVRRRTEHHAGCEGPIGTIFPEFKPGHSVVEEPQRVLLDRTVDGLPVLPDRRSRLKARLRSRDRPGFRRGKEKRMRGRGRQHRLSREGPLRTLYARGLG